MPKSSFSFSMMSKIIARGEASIIETGSSATISRGLSRNARATMSRWRWPPSRFSKGHTKG